MKKTISKCLWACGFISSSLSGFGQESFLKVSDTFAPHLGEKAAISLSKSGNLSMAIPDYPGFTVVDFDNNGNIIDANRIRIDSTDEVHWVNIMRHHEESALVSFSLTFNSPIAGVCKIGNKISDSWCRRTAFEGNSRATKAYSTISGNIFSEITYTANSTQALTFAKLSPITGNADWCFSYKIDTSQIQNYQAIQVTETLNEDLIISVVLGNTNSEYGLLKLNSIGEILHAIKIDSEALNVFRYSGIDTMGHIYLHGSITNFDNSLGNRRDGFIAQFDSDLNLIWAKRLFAENFNTLKLSIKGIDTGSKAEQGVYVLTFSYLNLRNDQEEVVSGDVLVVR